MSEVRHTPGPWKWWTSCSFRRLSSEATGHDGDVLHAVIQGSDGHPDVRLPNGGWDGPDGRLIAAAPELLEALRNIVSALGHEGHDGWHSEPVHSSDVKQALAAIAKATGATP
jgi:hypothetical protein